MIEATWRGHMKIPNVGCQCIWQPDGTVFLNLLSGTGDVDARTGHGTLLSADEEQKLVTHISYMADIGYGYNKSGIQYMACDYTNSLGKVVPATEQLSN